MTILTEKEREDVYKYWLHSSTLTNEDGLIQLAEKAVLEKLAGMELPQTVWVDVPHFTYTAVQLHQAFAQGAASQLSAEPEAYIAFADNGNIRIWGKAFTLTPEQIKQMTPLYTLKAPK